MTLLNELGLTITQANKNTTEVCFSFSNVDSSIELIQIHGEMLYQDTLIKEFTIEKKMDELEQGSFVFHMGAFGKWNLTITTYLNNKPLNIHTQEFILIADKYNLAFIDATLPTLLFSLKVLDDSILYDENGTPIPTIITLIRPESIDWDALPNHVYACPYTKDHLNDSYLDKYKAFRSYFYDLYNLNPNSYFTLYITDCYMSFELPQIIWAKDAPPEGNYGIRLLTDGGLSYLYYKNTYDEVDDAENRHQEMVNYINTLKQKALLGERIPYDDPIFGEKGLQNYIYAMLDVVDDAEWWLLQKNDQTTMKIHDKKFSEKVMNDARIKSHNIRELFNTVQNKGKDEVLKKLFKYDDSLFDIATKQNKKIMIILGSAKRIEDDASLDDYVNITKKLYGDEYVYFYKSHPTYLPEKHPGRLEKLQALGLIYFDTTTPIELFVFYHPEICISGYYSSTFLNLGDSDTIKMLYHKSMFISYHRVDIITYAPYVDTFISKLSTEDSNHTEYLVEFNRDPMKIGIYDTATGELNILSRT